eukprot:scaffold6.g2543.t1
MSEQDSNAPLAPKHGVAKGVGAPAGADNQWWLAGSTHPYAPFVGNALKWESYAYDDGTTYEGLMMNDVPHGKGVLVFGNGLGGGIQKADRADKYEGEFHSGFAHGLGQYTSTKGKVYKGEYTAGARHGCGAEYDISPFIKLVEQGMDPDAAWAEAQPAVEKKVVYGTWLRDTYYSGPDDSGRMCHLAEIRGTLEEVDSVVAKARMFQHKPDGEVTLRFAQDASGAPAPLMQARAGARGARGAGGAAGRGLRRSRDPLHYPHSTKFLAPGPLGQVHPMPDDDNVKAAMLRAADTHRKIHEHYNLPYAPEPGSVMDKAMRLWRRRQARRQRALEKKLLREQQRIRRLEAADAEAGGGGGRRPPAPPPEEPPAGAEGGGEEEEEELDDDDLIACTLGLEQQQQQQQRAGGGAGAGAAGGLFAPPTVVASVSVGLARGAAALAAAFHRAAVRAPARRCLTRPSHRE